MSSGLHLHTTLNRALHKDGCIVLCAQLSIPGTNRMDGLRVGTV